MQELGSIQNVGRGAYVNDATPRKAVRDKGGGGDQPGRNAASVIDNSVRKTAVGEPQNTLRKNLTDAINAATSEINRRPETATSSKDRKSASDYWKMDRSFGVEKLSYKNMWKVLKTVVREIGDIKEASSGQFFLGVSERLEKANTDMEFNSIADYMARDDTFSGKMVPTEATDGEAEQIVVDPEASLQAQANVVPDTALRLLGGVG